MVPDSSRERERERGRVARLAKEKYLLGQFAMSKSKQASQVLPSFSQIWHLSHPLATLSSCGQVRGRAGMNRELHRLFDNLAGRTTAFRAAAGSAGGGGPRPDGLVPVDPARFQVRSTTTLQPDQYWYSYRGHTHSRWQLAMARGRRLGWL